MSRSLPTSLLLLLLGMISVQGGASLAKGLFPLIGPLAVTSLRLGFGALMLLAVVRPWRSLRRERIGALIGYGVSLGLMNLTFYMGLQTLPLGPLVAIEFLGPLAVAVIGARRAIDLLWPALAVAGLLLLLPIGIHDKAALDPVGIGFALAAAACWGIYIVVGRRASEVHGGNTAALGMVVAALVAAPFGIVDAGHALLSPTILGMALLVGLLASAIPNSLEMLVITRVPMRTYGVLMSIVPVVAALVGFVVLGERLLPLQMLAMAMIVTASAGSVLTAEKPVAPENPD